MAQADFDELRQRYDAIIGELTHLWPATGWSGGVQEAALRSACAGFDTTCEGLRTFQDLNIDQVNFALDTMRSHAEELERLLTNARAASDTQPTAAAQDLVPRLPRKIGCSMQHLLTLATLVVRGRPMNRCTKNGVTGIGTYTNEIRLT